MAIIRWLIFSSLLLLVNCAPPTAPAAPQPSPTATPPSPTATAELIDTPTATAVSLPTATATQIPPTATATTPPTPSVDENGRFTVYANEPVVPHGPAGAWDGQFTDPGAVVYHDGQFHMFHNGFVGWPATVAIAYSTSADGYTWSRVQDEAVFHGNDLDYAGLTVLASSALVTDDGTWVLYFYTWDALTWPARGAIGRATASSPTGPWTADLTLILPQGGAGSWDDYAVRAPSVVRTDEGYVMFYAGYTQQQGMIGMATSPDGITWAKYNDPATTEAPFSESDPVFLAGDSSRWDVGNVLQPRVEYTPDGFVMLYSATTQVNGRGSRLGIAISQDGLTWERFDAPVLEAKPVPHGLGIWYTELLYANDSYFLYFELGAAGPPETTEVYLATYEGLFKP